MLIKKTKAKMAIPATAPWFIFCILSTDNSAYGADEGDVGDVLPTPPGLQEAAQVSLEPPADVHDPMVNEELLIEVE